MTDRKEWAAAVAAGETDGGLEEWAWRKAWEAEVRDPYVRLCIAPLPGQRGIKVGGDPDDCNVSQREPLTESDGTPITGKVQVVVGPVDPNIPFKFASKVYTDPTFGSMVNALKAQIRVTRDVDHCYLEALSVVGHRYLGSDLITLVELHTGS